MKKYKVLRGITDDYGGEEIIVEAEDIHELYQIVEKTPLTSKALKEIHWGIEEWEEIE